MLLCGYVHERGVKVRERKEEVVTVPLQDLKATGASASVPVSTATGNQQTLAAKLLYCLQYPVQIKSCVMCFALSRVRILKLKKIFTTSPNPESKL